MIDVNEYVIVEEFFLLYEDFRIIRNNVIVYYGFKGDVVVGEKGLRFYYLFMVFFLFIVCWVFV